MPSLEICDCVEFVKPGDGMCPVYIPTEAATTPQTGAGGGGGSGGSGMWTQADFPQKSGKGGNGANGTIGMIEIRQMGFLGEVPPAFITALQTPAGLNSLIKPMIAS
jgi:hypothetical protein